MTALIKEDRARGITTRLYALDSASDAKKVHAQAVSAPTDVAAIKAAIDQINAVWQPAYIVLLGGPDLVATVNLTNPLWTGNPADDPDQFIPSDLPYACDGPLTLSPADYRGPTRVVGRLPDPVGDADLAAFVDNLSSAAQGKSFLRTSPEPVFAVSAKVWQRSTQLSVAALPDVSGELHTSPPDGPMWTAAEMAPAIHFVNCHGAEFDPNWYGQLSPNNWNLPVAIAASGLPGLVPRGAVVASECCYGTSHWPPSAAHGQASVATTYLREGAAGVFGASTVAYGPAASNAYADVICRMFVSEVLNGASLGRAVLVARQRFVQAQSFLDPTDLKTLAQFNLLGDPAAVAFVTSPPAPPALPGSRRVAAPKSVPTPATSRGRSHAPWPAREHRRRFGPIDLCLCRPTAPAGRAHGSGTGRAPGPRTARADDDTHVRRRDAVRTTARSTGDRGHRWHLTACACRVRTASRHSATVVGGRTRGRCRARSTRGGAQVMTQHVRGVVSVQRVARGSKSEQPAVVLQTPERSWVLRRVGGPPFGVDVELALWAGKTVDVTGYAGSGVFLLTERPTEVTG